MNVILSLTVSFLAVFALVVISFAGVWGAHLHYLFGIVIPYIAVVIFLAGIIWRVVRWGRSPVPFRIPSTCGQQKTLPWIKKSYVDYFDNPHTTFGVVGRMILEVLFFRSLFRNTRMEFRGGQQVRYGSAKWLWLGAIVFHYTFLVVLIRHLRFFTEPNPFFVRITENIDGFFQFFVPTVYQSGFLLGAAVTFLLLRRILLPKVRYISLPADYFPLFLIIGIAFTGILMRYIIKTDVVGVKELTMGLVHFNPKIPEGVGVVFYIHLFLVSILFAYFPFSKLVHMAGVFFSMTRNMASNNRAIRHVNPWEYPVKVFSYMDQEDMYRKQMKAAGIPLERDTEE